MSRHKPVNLQQGAFVPIRFDRPVLPYTSRYALHYLPEHTVCLSALDSRYDNDEVGARH